jgi:GTP-binding protein Era
VVNASIILAINKLDTLQADEVMPRTQEFITLLPDVPWVTISALNQAGTAELLEALVAALPEGPRYYPAEQTTDAFMRDIASEMIREQIMLQLRDEVPYGTAVQVDEFKERERGKVYISANIFIERESHKPIIIGKKGSQLRKIGAAARKEIEAMVEQPVFLELWVKVLPQWRRDEQALRRFGYSARDK